MKSCPCGGKNPYSECCAIIHKDISAAKTAEQLMRSRYSAFTKADGDYLMSSHHETTRPLDQKLEIVNWAKSVKWMKLEILSIEFGQENDKEGFVEFKAHFKHKGQKDYILEKSKFVKENGIWYYFSKI